MRAPSPFARASELAASCARGEVAGLRWRRCREVAADDGSSLDRRVRRVDVHPTFTVTAIRGDAWTGTLARVFEALSNFRDVGGHVTADGRKLRSGLVYRSDALCFVTERDRALLRETLRIRTIVDLRTSMEHERMGRYDLTDVGEVVHLPVLDGALISEKAHDGSLDLASMYQAIAFDHADEIALVLTLLADPDRLPAIDRKSVV